MKLTPTPLGDAWLIDLEPSKDTRGFFLRAYCELEFSRHKLNTRWRQTNHSYSASPGTLRGLHYQREPHQEIKLVRCLRGIVHDVIVDLRAACPTRYQWFGVELDAKRLRWLYVPQGFAHGFLTLTPDVEMEYMASESHAPEVEAGIRYNDPHFDIQWPRAIEFISPKDASWPNFESATGDPVVVGRE
jgi:dTDP-4-dehydrorhamnose 3,5-epimerase